MATTKTPASGSRKRTPAYTGGPERDAAQARPHGRRAAERACARNTTHVELPVIGSVTLPSRDQLAFIGGMGLLAAVGLLEWPVAAVVGAGHLIAANRGNQALNAFGEALEEA